MFGRRFNFHKIGGHRFTYLTCLLLIITSMDCKFYVFDLGFMCGTICFLVPELIKLINFTYSNATK